MERSGAVSAVCVTLCLCVLAPEAALADVVLQSESRDRFGEKGFAYFFIEAEDFHDNNPRGAGESWLLSSDPQALAKTVDNTGLEPDPWAFASGEESITNALFTNTLNNEVGGEHDVQYLVEFDTPGTYYLYIRQHSPLGPELDRNKNDSFYYPVEFGESPRQLKANGDDYGILESMALPDDTFRRGPWLWFAARHTVENSEQSPLSEQNPDMFQEYVVTEDMVGEVLVLELDHREDGVMLDAFLFIETDSGLPPTDGWGPDGLGFFGPGDEVDLEFDLDNYDPEATCPAPEIDEISPAEGGAGDEIAITGANLTCAAADTIVTICDIEAEVTQIDATSITAIVPECVQAGAADVTVSHEGFESDTVAGGFVYTEATGVRFKRGDCDGNDRLEGITDAVFLLGYSFLGGDTPPCLAACDCDVNQKIEITDAVRTLQYFFLGGDPPLPPFPECGPGTEQDEFLGCENSPCMPQ